MSVLKLDEAGFDDLFTRVITPAMAPHEGERQKLVARFKSRAIGGALLGALLALLVFIFTRDDDAGDLGVLVAVVMAGFAYWPLLGFAKRCKVAALTALAGALDMTYQCEGFEPSRIQTLRSLGLLPPWDDGDYEDLFTGSQRGCRFELYEARQTKGSGKEQETTFSGQIIRVAFPKTFLGTTVVNRQRFLNRPPKGLERIRLESMEFEKLFEVYGNDQVEGRYLVHPVFMEKLMAVEAAAKGRNLRCCFDEGDLIIVIEGSNLFEVIEVFNPLPNREKTREGVTQIQQLIGLIEAVLAPPPRVYGSERPEGG